jgi:multiple sugar transport system substrate-binding protein
MRRSTVVYLAVMLLCLAGLVWSILRAGPEDMVAGKRIYRFACWGAAEEISELRRRVIEPINARADRFVIELMPIPGDYPTKLQTMIAGQSPPDFFYLSQEYIPAYATQGALLDVTDAVAQSEHPALDTSGYYASALAPYRWDGRLWALPWIAQPVILYCNVDLFAQAGVELPDGTWRWADFVAAGKKLTRDTDADGRIEIWGFALNNWPPAQIWIWQNDGELIDQAALRANLNDPRVLEGLNFKASLIHTHRIAPPLARVGSAVNALFRAGRCAMFMGGAADDLDRLEGLSVVARTLPAGPRGTEATFAWSAGLCVSASVQDRELALEASAELLDGIHHWKIPAPRRELAARLEHIEPRKARAADVIRRAMETMRTPVALPQYQRFHTLLWKELEEPMLRNNADARSLADEAAEALESIR